MTPNILKETNQGIQCYSIVDDMLQRREVFLTGQIDLESANDIIKQLLYLERIDPDKEIKIYINSGGGEVSSGLAIYDVMQNISCPVRTICMGLSASMAAVLLVAGDVRDIYEHSRIMIHDPLMNNVSGNALHIRDVADDILATRKMIAEIMSEHTGKTIDEIYNKTYKDSYFTAEEAFQFGLIDNIIKPQTR